MSDEQLSLEGILSDEKPAEKVAPVETVSPTETTPVVEPVAPVERPTSKKQKWQDREQEAQGRVRDPETGQYAAKVEPTKEPVREAVKEEPAKPVAPQQEFTEKEKAFLRTAQEERGKRQELERRLAALEASKPKEPDKTFWDDPEAALKKQKDEIAQVVTGTRLQVSEQIARTRFTDFDEKVAKFAELATSNPILAQHMLNSPDPASFAYMTAKSSMELEQAGGMDALLKKREEETRLKVRAEIEAELKAKHEAALKERAAIPGSLSDARSTGNANRPVWSGPTSLDNILGKG